MCLEPAPEEPAAGQMSAGGAVRPASTSGPAPRPSVPMDGELEAGALLESMRDEERY